MPHSWRYITGWCRGIYYERHYVRRDNPSIGKLVRPRTVKYFRGDQEITREEAEDANR